MQSNVDIFIYENFTFGGRHYKTGMAINWAGENPAVGNGPMLILPDEGGAAITRRGSGHLLNVLRESLRKHFKDENFKDYAAMHALFCGLPNAKPQPHVRLIK